MKKKTNLDKIKEEMDDKQQSLDKLLKARKKKGFK